MEPTDTSNPDYYHRVVDCQWACPAHTDVPEYIRLIAEGRFTEAYMVNRLSNVFPGILGRVCDRPCEPACRRGRVEQKPVAICRLKRVAADLRDDISTLLPSVPKLKNGRRVACIGAGCASLTVANDLVPLGYEVTIFEQAAEPGGLMRTNIPSFRLPHAVLAEEIASITDRGVELQLGHPIPSMRELLQSGGFDAVFVGSGAPRGKELKLPGRDAGAANIHIGIAWLESVAFGHIEKIGERVLIIGVGNTAMDCCRTSLRLGAKNVKVMARKPRGFFKASAWELDDAEEESVEIVVNRSPKSFVIENGKLTGISCSTKWSTTSMPVAASRPNGFWETNSCPPTMSFWRSDRKMPSPDRTGPGYSNSDQWDVPEGVDETTFPVDPHRGVFSAAMRPSVPRTSSGPSSTVTRRRSLPFIGSVRAKPWPGATAAWSEPAKPQNGHARVVVWQRLRAGRAAPDAPCIAQRAL